MSASSQAGQTPQAGQTETRAHPSMVLGAYLERLVRGRRVAVLGDASIGLGERLFERGARLVHAYDPDAGRASEAFAKTSHERTRHVTHATLEADLGVRDGAFDVVVLPDLSLFGDPSDVLRKARKLVGQTGVCVIASPNPDAHRRLLGRSGSAPHAGAPGYYALYDIVSLQFPIVRMLGQAPFVGYTIADFAAGPDLEVSVDTSLLQTTEEPEHFIAIASEKKVTVDPFVVIEMPLVQVREALGPTGLSPETLAALSDAQTKLTAAESRAKEIAVTDQRAAHESERAAAAIAASARVVELEAKLEKLREVDARASDTHVRAERLTHQIRDLDEELRRQRDRATKLAKQLDDEKKARTKAELELGLARGLTDAPGTKERITELTAELGSTRARALELEGELSAASLGIDELSGDRAALRARIAELEIALAARMAAAAPDPATLARIATLEATVARVESDRRTAEKKAHAQGEALAAAAKERDHLAEKNQALEKRAADLVNERAASETNAPDMDALEAKLRERGQTIAALERDLRESTRIGKELVAELEAAREAAPDEPPPAGGSGDEPGEASRGQESAVAPTSAATKASEAPIADAEVMRTQLDTLAARAARSEADLKAAEWRIAQLEHALAAAERGEGEPAAVAVELEQALLAAHQELATMRRTRSPEGGHVMPGVVEQSVLMHQLSNELGRATT